MKTKMTPYDDIERKIVYLRPKDKIFWWSEDYSYHDNLYGITVIFDVNHTAKEVEYTYSICKGENFDKYIGRYIAHRERDRRGGVFSLMKEKPKIDILLMKLISTLLQENSVGISDGFTFESFNCWMDLFLLDAQTKGSVWDMSSGRF